ncbi:MAG: hypothetical protein AVDCRST_MAG40-3264, partial [uncultured Gemmatimonadaceae bacterium]
VRRAGRAPGRSTGPIAPIATTAVRRPPAVRARRTRARSGRRAPTACATPVGPGATRS